MTSPLSYSAGTAFLTVVPSFRNIQRELGELAEEIGRNVDRSLSRQLPRSMRNAVRNSSGSGREFGRRFGQDAEREIRSAMSRLPEIRIPTNDVERRLRNVRRELAALRPARVGIDLDDQTFLRRLHAAQRELDELIDDDATIHLRMELEESRDQLRRFLANDLIEQSRRSGTRSGGEFSRLFADRVRRSAGAIEIEPRFDMSGVEFKLFQLSQQLRDLSGRTIGVDLDAGQAIAQLRVLQAQLAWLALNSPDVEIRTNAARAAAELMAILQLAHRIDGTDIDIDTDAGGAAMRRLAQNTDIPIHRLGVLIALALSIGPIIVPAAAAAAVAIGGIATAALAAVSGVGVLVLSLSGVFKAVQALSKYQQDADASAKSLSASQNALANAADGVRSAERSLANTRASVASANRRAASAVANAQDAVTKAVRDRKRAEDDLIESIKEAQKADEDRRRSIRGTALDIRQANLDIAEAKRELDKVLANPRSSEEEREQARINYEQRVLQLEDLQAKQKDLAEEQAKWNKEGVNGSDQVKSARDRLQAANEKVAESQERLAESIQSQQDTQRQGAYQLEQATQSLTSAQRSLQQATVSAGVAGGDALDNLNDAMAALSPAGQKFARFVFGLKDEFLALRAASEEAVLPGLQRGIENLMRFMPGFTNFVSRMGTEVGDSFAWAIQQMQHPEWQRFFRHISQTAIPAWRGMIRFGEAFSRGLASLIVALSAFNGSMGRGLLEWAEGFAEWAETLEESRGFQRFLDYVREAGPDVLHFLGQLFELAKRLIIAWAPVGDVMLKILTEILEGINELPIGVLTFFLSIIAALSAAMLLFKGAGVLWRAVTNTIATGARAVTSAWRTMNTLATGNTTSTTRYSRALVQIHRGFAALPGVVNRAATAVRGFMAASATGARVTALLGASAALGAYRTAVQRLSAVVTPAATRVGAFFTGLYTRASAAAVSAGAAALGAYRSAISRLTTVLPAAAGRIGAFFTGLYSRAGAAAVTAGATALGAYRTAVSRLSTVMPAAAARATIFMTAVSSRVSSLTTAATSMGTYRAAATALGTALIPVTLRNSAFFAAIRAGATSTGQASAAMRILSRTWLDARIILSTTTTAVQRWAVSTGLASTASAAWARTLALMSPALARVGTVAAAGSGAMARLASSLAVFGVSGTVTRGALAALNGVLTGFTAAVGTAAAATSRFVGALTALGTAAAGRTMTALSSLAGFLGGPWGIALTIATLGLLALVTASQRAKQRFKELRDSLVGFAQLFDEGFTPAAYESAEAMLRQDSNLRKLMTTLKGAGFDTREIVDAINGEEQARTNIVRSLEEQIRQELHLAAVARSGSDHETVASKVHADRAKALKELKAALEEAGVSSQRAQEIAEDLRVQDIATADDQRRLNEAFRDGARAADILRAAYRSLYGEAQSREEALDAERAAYDRLRASVEKNGATLDANTEQGRENRQNMRDRIQTLADLAAADIAATGEISADTQKRIDKLKQELIQMGFNEAEIDKMIKLYLGVPPKILTQIILMGGANAQGELNEVGKKALEMIATYNLSPSDAMIIAKGGIPPGWRGPSPSALAQAEGGHIRGPGTETSDSIPALLSDNEFVEPAHAVRHYGPAVFEAMRHHRIPKEHLAGFARGGLVDSAGVMRMATGGWTGIGGQTHAQRADVQKIPSWQMLKDYNKKLLAEKIAQLQEAWATGQGGGDGASISGDPNVVFPPWPRAHPGRGGPSGDSGVWRKIVALIKSTGPVSGSFGNAYRPGDPLWHGAGHAVDWMGFNQDALASFLAARRPLELIHRTARRDYAFTRGVNKGSFNEKLMNEHRNHVHIAMKLGGLVKRDIRRSLMDSGGWLHPGLNMIENGLRKPEAVLTPSQSAALVQLAQNETGPSGPRTVNHFQFRDTRLDPSKLAAINRAEEVYARVGRSR